MDNIRCYNRHMGYLEKYRGFSLIELLVALAILAVVAAMIVPHYLDVTRQASRLVQDENQRILQETLDHWIDLGGRITVTQGGVPVVTSCTCFFSAAFMEFLASSDHPRLPVTTTEPGTGIVCTISDSSGSVSSASMGVAIPFAHVNSNYDPFFENTPPAGLQTNT